MNDFQKTVRQEFGPLLLELGFKLVNVSSRFAGFAVGLGEKVAMYVLVHDSRAGGGNLEVAVWVAPIEAADDALDKLGVGLKVIIAASYEVPLDFFSLCAQKIKLYYPRLAALREVVEEELANPIFITKRLGLYEAGRKWWELAVSNPAEESKKIVAQIQKYFSKKNNSAKEYEVIRGGAESLIRLVEQNSHLKERIPSVFWTLPKDTQIDIVLRYFMSRSEIG